MIRKCIKLVRVAAKIACHQIKRSSSFEIQNTLTLQQHTIIWEAVQVHDKLKLFSILEKQELDELDVDDENVPSCTHQQIKSVNVTDIIGEKDTNIICLKNKDRTYYRNISTYFTQNDAVNANFRKDSSELRSIHEQKDDYDKFKEERKRNKEEYAKQYISKLAVGDAIKKQNEFLIKFKKDITTRSNLEFYEEMITDYNIITSRTFDKRFKPVYVQEGEDEKLDS